MSSPAPPPDDETVIATGPDPRHGPVRRAELTTRRLAFRLFRPVSHGMPPVWNRAMVLLVAGGVCVTLAAAFLDPLLVPALSKSGNAGLRFLASVTDAMKSGWYIVPAVIVMFVIAMMDWRYIEHRSRRSLLIAYGRAAYILAALAIPGVGVNILKQIVGRARPTAFAEYGALAFHPFQFAHEFQSFPSGHAATAGSLAAILILWRPPFRWLLFFAMFTLAFARIPAGAHYPSDVVAGFAIGLISAVALARWLARRRAVFALRNGHLLPVLIG